LKGAAIVMARTHSTLLLVALLVGCSACEGSRVNGSPGGESPETGRIDQASTSEQIIVDFIEAWSRLDPAELASFFAEDGIYHNIPSAPVQGRSNVEAFIRGFTANWTETTWDILTIMSVGDTVMVERLDRTRAGDRSVDLPVIGVFELEDGLIKAWRDYFDLATYTRAMS
jgi:limonene-1,2-epoxide hydrolase